MPLELVDPSSTYELTHSSGAAFTMRHWTVAMQEEVDTRCYVQDGKGGFQYLPAIERELKITNALAGWRGVTMNGEAVECTPENRKKLPVGVMLWLVKDIDDRAGLRMTDTEKKI